MTNIKSVTYCGQLQTYDLEVEHPDHQFYLNNGILTSNSHATAYAIVSWMCAYLSSHYTDTWVCTYLDSMSSNDDDRIKSFMEVRILGYNIIPLDINLAELSWSIPREKSLMPSLLSCKGVGEVAAKEIMSLRPFKNIDEFFWKDDGTWKFLKISKDVLQALIRTQAFDSFDIVGEKKLFKNYHHFYKVVIDHLNEIKKSLKRNPFKGKQRFYELVEEYSNTPDWTKKEKLEFWIKYYGSVDIHQIMPKELIQKLEKSEILPIDKYPDEIINSPEIYWFCIINSTVKVTKTNKKYLSLDVVSLTNKIHKVLLWRWNEKPIKPFTLAISKLEKNEYGMNTTQGKTKFIRELT